MAENQIHYKTLKGIVYVDDLGAKSNLEALFGRSSNGRKEASASNKKGE